LTQALECIDQQPRKAGVLLHLTSLPGGDNCCLGAAAHRFVDFLASSGFGVWQMLPVNPVGPDGSPYQAISAFAGNTQLIDLGSLYASKWLKHGEPELPFRQSIWKAWQGFCRLACEEERGDFADFIERQAYWLEDFTLFQALRDDLRLPWWEWPAPLRDRTEGGLAKARSRLADAISCCRFEQYLFFRQWRALKAYANGRGIQLFGDVPIFVAHDSAEVWARPHLFELNEQGQPTLVAGVPPDYFSATGQRWGNPLYRWDVMGADRYAFWEQRIKCQLELFDLIRVDHFRGFESYWAIPAHEPVAIHGSWMPGPGEALFKRLRKKLGDLPLVAEDLGVITNEVRALKEKLRMPGMKILHFAFSGNSDNPYLPYNHERCSVVYTGTHDNDTTIGWYQDLDEGAKAYIQNYLGHPTEPMPWPLIRLALGSRSQLAILPMQDLLELDGEHRMNTPGTVEGNWSWSFEWGQLAHDLAPRLRGLLSLYGRING
jgi:4-alpha-glucanotransferase